MLHAQIDIVDRHSPRDGRRAGTERVPVGQPTTVRGEDLAPLDVVVEDLSSTGFRFRYQDELPIGTVLHVGLAGAGTAQAQVAWTDNGRHGCEFVIPLNGAQLQTAFTSSGVVAGEFPATLAGVAPLAPYQPTKYPGPVRLAVAFGGAGLCWAAVLGAMAAIAR